MSFFNKIKISAGCLVVAAAVLSVVTANVSTKVYAASPSPSPSCGTTKTRLISCDNSKSGVLAFQELIRITVMVMTVLIGIVATGGIAYAAILYSSARDSQTQVEQSITIIRNIVIGLLLYVFMVAIINWLIPGGIIG